MAIKLTTNNGKTIQVEEEAFSSGGQGGVHHIIGGQSNLIAKIFYHESPEKLARAKKLEARIDFMIKNSPVKGSSQTIQNTLVWPREMLYRDGHFVGFIMPVAGDPQSKERPVKLTFLCKPDLSRLIKNLPQWDKFKRTQPKAMKTRLNLCYNIARTIQAVHDAKNYVLVDLKPDNILINSNGWMSIIDMDSIQISRNNQLLFPAEVFTEEYVPPEWQKNHAAITKSPKDESWDRFSYAVLAYQLLLGIHPFTASHAKFHATSDFIREGLFPNGRRKSECFKIPQPHMAFTTLPLEIQTLFLKCFEDGYTDPAKRPSMQEWSAAIIDILNRPAKIHWFKSSVSVRENRNPVRISWQVDGADKLLLDGKTVTGLSWMDVTPDYDTTYTLEAVSGSKSVKAQLLIKVDRRAPVIQLDCQRLPASSEKRIVKLKWHTEHAEEVQIDQGIGKVAKTGNMQLTIEKDTVFTVTAVSPLGIVSSKTVSVVIIPKLNTAPTLKSIQHKSIGRDFKLDTENRPWNKKK